MKSILLICSLISASAWASSYKLTDEDILGKYVLHKANKKSDVQWAEVKFNTDNKLVVITNRDDNQYELTGPDKNDLVFTGTDEANCDGDEPSCVYDAETKIWLSKVKGGPQLTIDISTDDAFDESGKSAETTEYLLDWDKDIPDAIPFYTNMKKNPKPVETLIAACKAAIKSELGKAISNAGEICSNPNSVKYRGDFDKAWKWFVNDWVGEHNAKDVKKYSDKKLQGLFDKQIEEINKIADKDLVKLSKADLVQQATKVQKYISENSDSVYVHLVSGNVSVFSINEKAKIIVNYTLDIHL
jgi:hypothetical protein